MSEGVALAGAAGLLLDYRNGPVRPVQLFVYVMLAVGIIRFARVASTVHSAPARKQDIEPKISARAFVAQDVRSTGEVGAARTERVSW